MFELAAFGVGAQKVRVLWASKSLSGRKQNEKVSKVFAWLASPFLPILSCSQTFKVIGGGSGVAKFVTQ